MPKPILFYTSIDEYSAIEFINKLDEIGDEDVLLRICSSGGDVEYGFGIVNRWKEHKGKKQIKVDGKAHSMMAYFLCYADDAEALEMSEFVIHRAASWMEAYPDWFDEGTKASLINRNNFLRKALEAKVDVEKFEALPQMQGKKLKDIFSLDSRIDIRLTAKDAKSVGLINRIVKITPEAKAEINSIYKLAASSRMDDKDILKMVAEADTVITENKTTEISKTIHMTLAEFKAAHPAVYAAAVEEGIAEGKKKEKDRVESILAFVDYDLPGVKAAIESGNPLTGKLQSEFLVKMTTKNSLTAVQKDSAETITTPAASSTEKPEGEKKIEEFSALLAKELGVEKI